MSYRGVLAAALCAACALQGGDFGNQEPARVDLVVAGDYVLTMADDGPPLRDAAVAIRSGRIVAVGPAADIDALYRARERIAGARRVVMPGLINGHGHAAMTILRGIADDLELITWLNEYIFPAEVRLVDEEFVRIGTELACWEMLRGGTTTFVDMYYFPDTVAEVVERCGLRALVAATVIDQPSPDAADAADGLAKASAFVARWRGRSERVTPLLGPHSVYTLSPTQLTGVRARAQELGVPISIHLAESRFEVETTRERYASTPIALLEEAGFFSGATIGAHVIYPTPEELAILARRHVGVIHNPTSNMKIASGIAPIAEMLERGIAVGLGTDGAATNNDLDLWEEMRLAAFLQKVATMDARVVPARQALRMATADGARAIGLGDELGALVPGYRADLLQVSIDHLHFAPLYDLVSHLVYVADEQDVTTVVVEGRIVMRDGEVLTLDAARIYAEAERLAVRIADALGITR